MAAPSTWVPHIEAFVDSSLASSQHDASIEAIATLVKKDVVTLLDVVSEMEMYLTTSDNVIRSRGILLLGEILARISEKALDRKAIDSLSDFFISRLADWLALRGALIGCHALLGRNKEVGSISADDVKRFSKFFFENVDVRSLAANDRKLCYEVLICFCTRHKEVATTQGEDLVYDILRSVDDELDPSCLLLAFQLVQSAILLFPILSDAAYQDSFEILSKYFPVYFTHEDPGNDATREELSDALLSIFCSTPYLEQHVIPFLLEKLSTSFSLAKLDSLKYLQKCVSYYGPDRMADHAVDIWHSLETVIFNKEEDQIAKEALKCFESTTLVLCRPNRDAFFGLICQKIDLVLNNSSAEKQGEYHAVGSILAIVSRVSDNLCTKIFQKYFARLVITLVRSAQCSLDGNVLYLVFEILSSCRSLIRSTDFTGVILERDSWLSILRNYSDELSAALSKLVNAATSFEDDALMASQENIICAINCLGVLATFTESYSPITDESYSLILKSLVLVISGSDKSTILWKSTLKVLVEIGLVAKKSLDRTRAVVYTTVVVEKLCSAFVASKLPLDLSLEALYGICTVGKNQMEQVLLVVEEAITVKISKVCLEREFSEAEALISLLQFYSGRILLRLREIDDASEVTLQFALRLWNQIDNNDVSKNIHVMGILDALMLTMKHLVAVSAVNHQSIILQKSYEIIIKSISCPSELFTTAFQNFEQLVSYSPSPVQDLNLISLFASVVTALSAQTPLSPSNSDSSFDSFSKLFIFFLLRGHVPAAQALASIMNKNSVDNKAFGSCLSILSENNKMFFKKDIVLGFAWIGKGLAMRGDDRSKEVIQCLLKLVFSSQHGLDVARSAADGLHIIMGDSEDCLSKQFHAVIKPLYKQRLFSTLMPVLLSSMNEATNKYVQREVVCRAFGHVISDAPLAAVNAEAKKILPAVADSIIALSADIQNKDIVYSLLLVLSGLLMDSRGKECIIENLHIVIGVLTRLVSYPHLMVVRETSIECLTSLSALPHSKIYPFKPQVLKAVTSALDDKRRAVRHEAVRCRHAWSKDN